MNSLERQATPNKRLCVVVLNGYASVDSAPLEDRALIVGRHSACAIHVYARGVSRRHCAIWHESGLIWVMDLASRNGTFVDGQPLVFGSITPGAIIQLGAPAQAALTIRCNDR